MTFEQIVGIALGLNGLITLANALYNITSASGSRALAEIKKLSDKLDEDMKLRERRGAEAEARFQIVESRVTMIERDLMHLPSKDSVTEVKLEISGVKGALGKMETSLTAIGRTVNLLDEYIRNHDKS